MLEYKSLCRNQKIIHTSQDLAQAGHFSVKAFPITISNSRQGRSVLPHTLVTLSVLLWARWHRPAFHLLVPPLPTAFWDSSRQKHLPHLRIPRNQHRFQDKASTQMCDELINSSIILLISQSVCRLHGLQRTFAFAATFDPKNTHEVPSGGAAAVPTADENTEQTTRNRERVSWMLLSE